MIIGKIDAQRVLVLEGGEVRLVDLLPRDPVGDEFTWDYAPPGAFLFYRLHVDQP